MGRKHEKIALEVTDNHEIEAKKNKNRAEARHNRKIEEAKSEVVVEVKKGKQKKKKEKREKREEPQNNGLVLDCDEGGELLNGSDEASEKNQKKKKKHKREEEKEFLDNGSDCAKEGETLNGKKKKQKKETDVGSFSNGSSQECDGKNKYEAVVEKERQSHGGVVVSGKNIQESKYAELKSFAESGLPKEVLKCCKNFDKPSPIQSHSWPFLLNGRDFIGIAATGSGKTLAFGIPSIMHVLQKHKNKTLKKVNPLCLVLSPTRELAQQISDVLCDAGKPCGLQSVCIYGGASKGPQISALKSGVDIVIGTAGRLKDLIEMGICL
ncbi:DEAD-box ATP-dependent RNA helicase 5-like [Actinidia eriantha]|uniref:DEAD-box ATP-dependent RNA helicase 5-like n=1 Tax=Actinidia eriantha TaxID=165200 RepID=UPI002587FF2F|nr:DEAD-box ATP-dependent RNA helicase 5-like [Actinidia eriantha]XP_057501911.1 DEAD-box ATP-dependent RNA helicase 5-like [Actinidia eriantha]